MAINDMNLSGKVRADGGTGVNGITAYLLETGADLAGTQQTTVTTDSDGTWNFTLTTADLNDTYDVKLVSSSGAQTRYIPWSDEITLKTVDTSVLKVRGLNSAAAPLYFFADRGDDAGDGWRMQATNSNTFAIGNNKAAIGTIIDYITITNGATAAASNTTILGQLTIGVDDTGADVKFFGATAGSFLLWDESDDALELTDSSPIKIGDGGDMTLYHDGSHSYITNATGALKLATETSGIAVTIGHTTSEVTVADNLTVTGTLTLGSGAELTEAELEFIDGITAGTAAGDKAVVLDSSKDIATIRNLTIDGVFTDGNYTFDTSGNVSGLGNVATTGTLTTGTDGSGTDVIFYSGTSGDNLTWDASEEVLQITGTNGATALDVLDGDVRVVDKLYLYDRGGEYLSSDGSTLTITGATTVSGGLTSTAASNSFGASGFGDEDITAVGNIALDSISAVGTDINIAVDDNSATALTIKQGSDAYLVVDTANSSESVAIGTGVSGIAVTIGHSTSEVTIADNLTVSGNLTVTGTQTIVDTVTMNAANALVFEGATADAHETTLTIIDPTTDRTVSMPNQSGYLPVLASASTTQISATPEELNVLDGVTAGTVSASLGVVVDSAKDIGSFRNITLTGELDAGSLDVSGDANIAGEVQTTGIGYTDGDNAITIADGGGITAAAGITSTASANAFGATSFGDTVITDGVITDSTGLSLAANVDVTGNLTTGDIEIGATNKLYLDGGTNTYVYERADNEVNWVIGGTPRLQFLTGGIYGWATGSPRFNTSAASSATQPTLNPSSSNPDTGIGGVDGTVAIITGGVARLTATAAGVIDISGGIKFPGAQVASADVNTLDDYEEGTWTPAMAFSSAEGDAAYPVAVGDYTKIGNRVYVNMKLRVTETTASGNITFSGLPFATNATTQHNFTGSVYTNNVVVTGWPNAAVADNSTTFNILDGLNYFTNADVSTNSDFVISMTYNVG